MEKESNNNEENQLDTDSGDVDESARLIKEAEDHKNKYLYLYADFENYKKRAIKERSELVKYGNESLIRDLLSVVDNLERALDASKSSKENNALTEGVRMVAEEFKQVLTRFGVVPIDTVGRKFDPEKHEAVSQEQTDAHEPGTVTKEHVKGYTLNGRLLRPAKVVVSIKN